MKREDKVALADELIAFATRLRIEAFPEDEMQFTATLWAMDARIEACQKQMVWERSLSSSMQDQQHYILARTYEDARNWVREGPHAGSFRYVVTDQVLRAQRGSKLYVLPKAQHRKDSSDILRMARERDMEIIYVDE